MIWQEAVELIQKAQFTREKVSVIMRGQQI